MIAIPTKFPVDIPTSAVITPVTLKDVIQTIPRECFQKSPRKAWATVLLSVVAAGVGYTAIAFSPWYLLPLAWVFTGTALTGWFVIGHDCGHRSFAKRRWVNDWVGHFFFLPLMYPFHAWRLLHDHHHLHTNKMHVDNAWHPWTEEFYANSSPLMKQFYATVRGRFWWIASIIHWAQLHFNPANVNGRHRQEVKVSIAVVVGVAAIAFPALIYTTGVWGVVKFWLVPWMVYHFWMSTFTLVHHTASDVEFRDIEDWDAVEAQLDGTIHCDYPRWVEVLCHDINVHVPHHISVGIPSYNLRQAHSSLKQAWGGRIKERKFSWSMLKDVVDQCHVFHPQKAYESCSTVNKRLSHR